MPVPVPVPEPESVAAVFVPLCVPLVVEDPDAVS